MGISEQESVALALFGQDVEYIETMKHERTTRYCQKQGWRDAIGLKKNCNQQALFQH